MFSFIKNFTNYGPKSFKGKSVKDILAMSSSKVPEDFFTDAYTQAHLQDFMDADLSEEQENAIDLLSDLKNKPEIIRKCYDKRKKRSQRQQVQQTQPQQQQQQQEQAQPQQPQQTSDEQQAELLEEPAQAEQQQQTSEQMNGGGRRKRTRKGKKSKKHTHSKKCKHNKKGKKSKRVRFSV